LSPFAPIDRWRAPPPRPERVGWLREWRYAHRGLHGPGVAENSPTAFDLAIRAGLGIECDIQKSGDGRAVVFHDWDLDRLTAESGAVSSRSASALSRTALREGGDTIPSLDAFLEQVAGRAPLLIEIKSKRDKRIGPICLAVRRALEGYRGLHAVMSFDPRVPKWFAEQSPRTVRGLVVTEEDRPGLRGKWERHSALWHGQPDFLAYDVRDLPSEFAASQRARGLPVLTWTVRSAALAEVASAHADAPIAEGEGLP
jgi:glycerophosphoryl diester phosphodiesterase